MAERSKDPSNWSEVQWKAVEFKLSEESAYTRRCDETVHELDEPCLEWIGEKNVKGYALISVHGTKFLGNVLACIIGNGYIRPNKLQAAHKCGNSSCVERKHLYFATAEQQIEDRRKHGTLPSKLDPQKVREIRLLYANEHMSFHQLGAAYKVAPATIRDVVLYNTWKHVDRKDIK